MGNDDNICWVEYFDDSIPGWDILECDNITEAQDEANRLDAEGMIQVRILYK